MNALLLVAALCAAAPARKPELDRTALEALVQRASELDTDALVVLKDGKPVLEKWFDGEPRKIESMSVTKSIVAIAVGRLVTTGKISSLDEPVHTWYPEWRQGRKRAITLRHLLTQTSGLQADPKTGSEVYPSPNLVQLALCAELADDPGKRFFYNNKATNLLAGIVERARGKRLDLYMKDEVFAPLGITDFEWTLDSAGNPHGMAGLQLRPADFAKLGQLMLDGGTWQGKVILSRAWVKEATSASQSNPRYGQLWWRVGDLVVTIDAEVLETWRKGGSSEGFLAALKPLEGRLFGADFLDVIGKALATQGGVEAWHDNTWRKGLPDGKIVDVKGVGFRAEGWQGQHLIILPADGLVVVRMRQAKDDGSDEENKKYGFGELTRMVRALVKK